MGDTPDTQPKGDQSSFMQAIPSASQNTFSAPGTAAAQQSSPEAARGPQQLSPEATRAASIPAQLQGSGEQKESVQTLTGVKEGAATLAPQEALAAPGVLEAAPPSKNSNMTGHIRAQSAIQEQNNSSAGADVG